MTADPRYPDDGLAALIDELEQRVEWAAWRPRYVLGMDGTRDSRVTVARAHDTADGSPWLKLADLERDLVNPYDADTARRLWLNSWTDTTQEPAT